MNCPMCKYALGRESGGYVLTCPRCSEKLCVVCERPLGKEDYYLSHFVENPFVNQCSGMLNISHFSTSDPPISSEVDLMRSFNNNL